jgi:hypothetical protein
MFFVVFPIAGRPADIRDERLCLPGGLPVSSIQIGQRE